METAARALRRPFEVSPYLAGLRRDAPLHCVVLAYAAVGYLLAVALNRPGKFMPADAYLNAAILVAVLPGLLAVLGWVLRRSVIRPELFAGLALFASLMLYVDVFAGVKSLLPDMVPFFADPWLAHLDEMVHGHAPWKYVHALVPSAALPFLQGFYFLAWAVAVMFTTLAAVLAPRLRPLRAQFAWTFLVVWPLLGNIVAAAAMSGGPIFYDLITGEPSFNHLMVHLGSAIQDHSEVRRMAWSAHLGQVPSHGFAISAFPSLHVAMATLLALVAFHAGRRWFCGALLLLAIILAGSVQLGWHYALDGYFSIAATAGIWKAVGWALRRTA
jgi:hypothetical protein